MDLFAIFTARTEKIPERFMPKNDERRPTSFSLEDISDFCSAATTTNADLLEILLALKESYLIDEAVEVAEKAVELYPYETEFYLHLSALKYNDGLYRQSLDVLDSALLINPCQSEIEVFKIKVLSKLERYDEAQELIDELSTRLMRSEWSLLYIAQAYLCQATGEHSSMYFYAKQAVSHAPESEEAYELLGRAVELSKEYHDAINFLNDCIDEDPYSHLAWYHLALAHASVGNYDRAILAYEYAFIANPDFLRAYIECAELCTELGYWRKSILVNMDIQEKFEDNGDCNAQMAKCYLHLRMVEPAEACLLELAKLDADHDELYFLLGDCFFVKKNWNKAILAYEKALEADPEHDEYIFRLARAYAKIGKSGQAVQNFKLAIDLGPEQDEYWFGFAKYLIKRGKAINALHILEQADEHTFSPKLDYLKSIALLRCNKRKEGLEFLSAALEEDQGHLNLFYKYMPEAKEDRQIQSIVNYWA